MIQHFWKFIFIRELKKRISGASKVLNVRFLPFREKRVFVLLIYINIENLRVQI